MTLLFLFSFLFVLLTSQNQWCGSFTVGTTYSSSSSQCTTLTSFLSSIPSTGVISLKVNGSINPTGYTCSNTASINTIVTNLKGTFSSTNIVACNGFNWATGDCLSSKEIKV